MLTVALTGGIGSGKTAVTEIFRQLGQGKGLEIIDSDTIARQLLAGSLDESPSEALLAVYNLFGPDLFDNTERQGRQLNRLKLRELVFSSNTKKKQLEDLMHPLIYQEIFSQLAAFRHNNQLINIVIIAIPLLFETASEKHFDRILVIDVPEKLQIERSMQRDQCSQALIEQIIASQVSRQTRLSHADDVINNSGTLSELHEQVKKLYQFYCSQAKTAQQA